MVDVATTDVLIVGAGLAGLSAAWHLDDAGGTDIVVLERESRPGGWAKTDWDGQWGADRGVHVLYFRDDAIRAFVEEILQGQWIRHEKSCVIDSNGVRTAYPFHANLAGRPANVVRECLDGLWAASLRQCAAPDTPSTFAEWIDLTMGAGVRRHFMDPYNTKMWTVPPDRMSCDWMGEFLPSVDREAVLSGIFGKNDSNVGLNASFYYPTNGISDLADRLANRLAGRVWKNTSLATVDALRHVAILEDGSQIRYGTLISTMPLDVLGAMTRPSTVVPTRRVRELDSLDLTLVDIGAQTARESDVHWVYFPDDDVLPYRIHLVHALTSRLVPPGRALFSAEISHSRHRPLHIDPVVGVVESLLKTGWLVSKDDIEFERVRSFKRAYLIPKPGYQEAAREIRDALRMHDIFSIGRYGEWKYSNMEDALISGREVAAIVRAQ